LCGIGAVRTRKGTASYHHFRLSKCTNAKLARCRQLLDVPPPPPPVLAPLADPHDRYQALTGRSIHVCPACSAGAMRRIEILPAMVGRSTRPAWADTS